MTLDMAQRASYWLTRFYFQRALSFIYLMGFLIAFNQFRPLCGEHGLMPIRNVLKRSDFWSAPSLFWITYSDRFALILALLGVALSVFALIGFSDAYGKVVSGVTWFSLWLIYLSFVNVGQTFYSFGWETLLLETGFLAIFLGPSRSAPPILVVWLLRWVLFRLMFGAGLIKIRGDECWRNLTCMNYHYETQPMPNPLSWYFHHLPEWVNQGSVLFNHFTELIVPFFYFAPSPFRVWAGVITLIFQSILIASGNFSWLNFISMVLCLTCFDDSILPRLAAWTQTMNVGSIANATVGFPLSVIYMLTGAVIVLSYNPIRNLISSGQVMNTSFEPLHLVNTYGAFGSITRTRYEVVLEGANKLSGPWKEYGFKGKPGDVSRMPPQVSPYHFKLDWQMWFAAMSSYQYHPWILGLVGKLLQGSKPILSLIRNNPFENHPPRYIRASLYEYRFSNWGDSTWWKREYQGEYLPALSLDQKDFKEILDRNGW